MNKVNLPPIQIPNSINICCNHQMFDRTQIDNHHTYQNQSFNQQYLNSFNKKSLLMNTSVWHRLFRIPTDSSYRHSCYYNEINSPKNDLDFRLRTCYNHAQESFASKARIVVQPMTIYQIQKQLNSFEKINYPFRIINENRKEHFNEATKGQHIGSDHFANGKHGYSRVIAGAMSID
ncbi:unnamed protein product [Rotaria sordida]|uniref:Uncharacterized protein n=1 Tax=Rotaria sordida TaxID=392033 RepID=A0A814M4X3_9BILA|nr:unnamed protein product [Rotaria sordida]CAF3635830.1 unnamed protein product [Rotaria sordida]